MKMFERLKRKHGSALLIVLGLLSFLMLSAVAFSISMRTEYAAANAYRTNVRARDLLSAAFADARAAVETAMEQQLGGAKPATNAADRTPERLMPFKLTGQDKYVRVLSSAGGTTAYLLDENMMEHVPPYVAYDVYKALEPRDGVAAPQPSETSPNGYAFNAEAQWKPITASLPERNSSNADEIQSATIGRMAWAVINLSDSIDINGIGSFSAKRGLGLSGNDFAFYTTAETSASGVETYSLLNPTAFPEGLEPFLSNADIARYAAFSRDGFFTETDPDGIYPHAWQDAVFAYTTSTPGTGRYGGFYSPFTSYSFWPNPKRNTEAGAAIPMAVSQQSLSCDQISVESGTLKNADKLRDLVESMDPNLCDSAGVFDSFVTLLTDYLDKDKAPTAIISGAGGGSGGVGESISGGGGMDSSYDAPNALPTVEQVPMLAEVQYDTSAFVSDTVAKRIADAIKSKLDGKGGKSGLSAAEMNKLTKAPIALELSESDLKDLAQISVTALTHTYGTDAERNALTGDVDVMGVIGRAIHSSVDNMWTGKAAETKSLSLAVSTKPYNPSGGGVGAAAGASGTLEAESGLGAFSIKKDTMPVAIISPAQKLKDAGIQETPKENRTHVVLTVLVDYLFRAQVNAAGEDGVDLAPTDGNGTVEGKSKYDEIVGRGSPMQNIRRVGGNGLIDFDRDFFRVSRALQFDFLLSWKIDMTEATDDTPATFSCELQFEQEGGEDVLVRILDEGKETTLSVAGQDLALASDTSTVPAHLSISPGIGSWKTIDPRYNWLPPMMGMSSGGMDSYFASVPNIIASMSSPHWIFCKASGSSHSTENLMDDYLKKCADDGRAPGLFGVEMNDDIRYSYNDSEQLYLPGEIGFLPVPLPKYTWTPTNGIQNYNAFDFGGYFSSVAACSYFRTLPIADFNDGAFDTQTNWRDPPRDAAAEAAGTASTRSTTPYAKAVAFCEMLDPPNFEGFPEEHAAKVHAFAGMDNFATAQRLRQFALLGIPATIKESIVNTRDRLKEANTAGRVSQDAVTAFGAEDVTAESTTTASPFDALVKKFFTIDSSEEGSVEADLGTSDGWRSEPRPQSVNVVADVLGLNGDGSSESLAKARTFFDELARLSKADGSPYGQNDLTTFLAIAKEAFGDRQQLFLYILRAEVETFRASGASNNRAPAASSRGVALVWRDAYGRLPDRVIYFQIFQ